MRCTLLVDVGRFRLRREKRKKGPLPLQFDLIFLDFLLALQELTPELYKCQLGPKESMLAQFSNATRMLKPLRLCEWGPNHSQSTGVYAHSLCELSLPPPSYSRFCKTKADRWVGQSISEHQWKLFQIYWQEAQFKPRLLYFCHISNDPVDRRSTMKDQLGQRDCVGLALTKIYAAIPTVHGTLT